MRLPRHLSRLREREQERRLTTTIWTIGHGDRSFDDVERQLAAAGITMIVDIRGEPGELRSPDFNRRRLEDLAADAGIGYRWMGTSLRHGSEADMAAGIEDLIALASVSSTVILGSDPEASRCRRSTVIAPALRSRGVDVIHLLPDGSTRRHESPLPFDQ
ncbi:MAG: DUF488 family protein [Acidimicrobiia bacterium]